MGGLSIWHFLIVLAVVLLIWGPGRISPLMGELAKGVKSFKKGLSDEPPAPSNNAHSNVNNAANNAPNNTPGVTAQNNAESRNTSAHTHSGGDTAHKG